MPKDSAPFLDLLAQAELYSLCGRFPLGYTPRLVWKNMRVTAGYARWRERLIVLSTSVLTTPEQVLDTLRHEFAHLLAVSRFGRRGDGHGEPWRQAMRDLGLEPRVHHSYDVVRNRKHQEVEYHCEGCGKVYLRQRQFARRWRYFCRCGGTFKLATVRKLTTAACEQS
jgi:predicted SprT family Zn-dependent metalloprotease